MPAECEWSGCNYFIIHTKSWHGLYQQHRHSASLSDFCDFISSLAKPPITAAFKKAVTAAGGRKKITAEKLKEVQEQHLFLWHPLFTRAKLEAMLKKWDSVTEVFWEVATVGPSSQAYGPLANTLKAEVHRLKLQTSRENRDQNRAGVIDRVVKYFDWLFHAKKQVAPSKSGVRGSLNKGTKTFRLENFMEQFDEDNLDNVLTTAELAIDDLRTSPLVRRLIDIAEDNAEYFGKAAT